MDQMKIGNLLQELRREKGMTQEELAEKLNVARRTVSRWETGYNLPDLDLLIELSDFYDVDLRELLDGERTQEKMDKEMKETVLKVAQYSNEEKNRTVKTLQIYFVLGLIGLAINQTLFMMEVGDGFWTGFIEGVTLGLAILAMLMGLLQTTGKLEKIRAFKRRLITKE